MRIYKEKDYSTVSRKAANIISAQIILKPESVLGLATGTSPIGTYNQLIDWYQKGDLDFSAVKTINLDEYLGLKEIDLNSYHYFMQQNLFSKVNINQNNIHIPDGTTTNIEKECNDYDKLISSLGGIDLQLLGLGQNGHIGFNEPADSYIYNTHRVRLSQNTIEANARLFNDINDVPKEAITMGIGSIMSAKSILLIASGSNKADALYKALYGPITPKVPASILQLHPNVTIVADEAALSKC